MRPLSTPYSVCVWGYTDGRCPIGAGVPILGRSLYAYIAGDISHHDLRIDAISAALKKHSAMRPKIPPRADFLSWVFEEWYAPDAPDKTAKFTRDAALIGLFSVWV